MRLSVIFRDPIQPIRSQERVLKLKQSEQRVLPVRVGTLLSRQCQQLLEGNQADAIHSKREKGPHLRANFFTSHPLWKGGGDHTDWAKLKSQEWGKKIIIIMITWKMIQKGLMLGVFFNIQTWQWR